MAVNDGLLVPDIFKRAVCTGVQEVQVLYGGKQPDEVICPNIKVDGRQLIDAEKLVFVRNEGFPGFAHFMEAYPVSGVFLLAHWTDFKY